MAFAHSLPGRPVEEWELLEEHLHKVAGLARNFAEPFGGTDWAYLAGLWHDLGKYREAFQKYLRAAGGDPDASGETPGKVDHSTVGAVHAFQRFGPKGKILGYLIAGHHAGLPDGEGGDRSLRARSERDDLLREALTGGAPRDVLDAQLPASRPQTRDRSGLHLWIRLLYSCLTDADFLATESFMNPQKGAERQPWPPLSSLWPRFEAYTREKFGSPNTEVQRAREEVRNACINGAKLAPGLFSLTVPTGGGKTLSSMAFALQHAQIHGKRRIIYVIPYTSIIEQTADTFREVFGDCVLEHHSNVDPDDPDRSGTRMRLAAENWDAPIVVTTNVQFFESLFSNRSSRCRKLHNLVDSVVVLDEAQLLPPGFLLPIRHAIELLAASYGVTFVISTATQPALGLSSVRELMPDPEALHQSLRRVDYEWPVDDTSKSWAEIAAALKSERQVLCIVSRRDDARELAKLLPEETIHLSALMCGAHRALAIADIRARLQQGRSIRVVSTQLVEAGVDVDFPVVFRAFAGLDSIAQAAGRCNREGRLPHPGRVVIFHPPRPAPRGLLRKAEDATKELLADGSPPELSPATFRRFFDLFFHAHVNSLDEKSVLPLLRVANPEGIQFREAADLFRLVDDSGYSPVVVSFGDSPALVRALRVWGISRDLGRKLQRFTVSIPLRQAAGLLKDGGIEEVSPGLFAQVHPQLYDPRFGLLTYVPEYEPTELVS
jgi:CRISPR-associated endonuclease/helicase Cas3